MYGSNGPPPPAPAVDLDDLFGMKPTAPPQPPPQPQHAMYHPSGGGLAATAAAATGEELPPPPYWDGNGNVSSSGHYGAVGNGGDSGNYASPQLASPPHAPQQQAYTGFSEQPRQQAYPQPQPQQPQQPHAYHGGGASPYPSQHPQHQLPPPLPQQQPQHPALSAQPQRSQEDEDREQLEKIIRLRKELEAEQQREQEKKLELETWGCPQCTFRNKLHTTTCEMCSVPRPGYSAAPAAPTAPAHPPQPRSPVPPSTHPSAATSAGETAWQCGMCLAPNEAKDSRCRVCYAYRASGVAVPQGPSPSAQSSAGGVQSRTPFTTNWKCSVCGKVNPPAKANCAACNGFQYNGTPVAGGVLKHSPAAAADGEQSQVTWQCSVCTLENNVKDAVCVACRSGQRPRHLAQHAPKNVAFAPGTAAGSGKLSTSSGDGKKKKWPCPQCTFHNSMRRSKCDMCGSARPDKYAPTAASSTVDRDSAKKAKKREDESDEDEVQWQDDEVAKTCNRCHREFGFLVRRHHCRACGYVFCAVCAPFALVLKKETPPQRVCVNCYEARQEKGKT